MSGKIWIVLFVLFVVVGNANFQGTFMYPQTIPQAQLNAYLTQIQSLGMDTVIVQFTRYFTQCGVASSYYWTVPLTYINQLLTLADSKSISVYIGLVLSSETCSVFYQQPNIGVTTADTGASVSAILALGTHTSLKGWYIPDEPAIIGWDDPSYTYSFYASVVNTIKARSALPILVSPYMIGASATKSPQYAATQALAFKTNTGVNVQVWQDSVGAAAINIYNRAGAATLRDYFGNISAAIGKNNMWSDLEAFNYGVPLDASSGGYRACSGVRLANQYNATSPYVSKTTTWIQQVHFGTIDTAIRKPEASRLLGVYQSNLLSSPASRIYLLVSSYSWVTAPSSSYPDTTPPSKLFNKRTADPLTYTDTQWVGVLGNTELVLDFGRKVTVQWIGVHTLTSSNVGIAFPKTLLLSYSNTGTLWTSFPAISLPFTTRSNGEYVLGNVNVLPTQSYRYLKVHMDNDSWTFLSEIECVGTQN